MNYTKSNNLLSTNNSKTIKGEKLGYMTYILYLAPHTQNSKGINLCSHASKGCAKACLFGSGAARFDNVQLGKTNKTEWFLDNRVEFLEKLDKEIIAIKKKAIHKDTENVLIPTIRLNGTSDIAWEKFKIRDNKNIFDLHSDIQFYDYTKNYIRFEKQLPTNYHLTFSMSEDNKDKSLELLSKGHNVAINAQQAKNVFFKGFKTKIEKSPWFAGKYEAKVDSIGFDKSITVYSGHSERESHEGLNLLLAVLDEISGSLESALKRKGQLNSLIIFFLAICSS